MCMNATPEKQAEKRAAITIRDLYPTLTGRELKKAEENFHRYIEIAMEIHEENFLGASNGALDSTDKDSNIKERSNSSLKS